MKKLKISINYALCHSGAIKKLLDKSKPISNQFVIITLVLGFMCVPHAHAQLNTGRVEQVKSAFILNIIRFITWPEISKADKDEQLLLCLYRDDALNRALANIQGKKSGGRTIQVRSIHSLGDSQSCHILVIAKDSLGHFVTEAPLDINKPVLTIVDLTGSESSYSQQGDIIVALVRKGTRIGFQINLHRSRQAGLWMSSKLLKLATIIGGEEQ